jgi:hypothetical protein
MRVESCHRLTTSCKEPQSLSFSRPLITAGPPPRLTLFAGIWVYECISIVFFTSIQASEILLNQKGERPEFSQADTFCDPDLIRRVPRIRVISRY